MSDEFITAMGDVWINARYVSQFWIEPMESGYHLKAHMAESGEWELIGVYEDRQDAILRVHAIMRAIKSGRC